MLKELDTIQSPEIEIKKYSAQSSACSRAKGSVLHDFYNACEMAFKIIAIEINGGFVEEERCYKMLLYKMTIKISEIRPAPLSKKLAARLDEYLGFRHLF